MKKKLLVFFATYFLTITVIGISLYFVVYGYIGILFVIGFYSLISVLVAKLLKRVIKKKRVHHGEALFQTDSPYGFPSSHAAGLSSLALSTYGFPIWFFVVVASAIILLSRVKSNVHSVKEIVAGLLVGVAVTLFLFLTMITLLPL